MVVTVVPEQTAAQALIAVPVVLPEAAVMAKTAVSQKAKKETGKKQNTQMMI